MIVTKVQKRTRLSLEQVLRFHLITELLFLRKLSLIPSDLDLLTLLALAGEVELPLFCAQAARHQHPDLAPEHLATREQNVRNRLVKLEKRGLIRKHKPGAKTLVTLISDLVIPLGEPVLLDYQFLSRASA